MRKSAKEYTPEQNKLFNIANDDIGEVYRSVSEQQALNAAIYMMTDNAADIADTDTREMINNALYLLNLQEERLEVLKNSVDNVVNKLFELINPTDNKEALQ